MVNLHAIENPVIVMTKSMTKVHRNQFLTIFEATIWLIEKISLILRATSLNSYVLKFK